LRPAGTGGGQPGRRPFLDERRLVPGHQREDPEHELAVAVVVSMIPVW
jgi:hypothetical protein